MILDINDGKKRLASEKNQRPPKSWSTPWDQNIIQKCHTVLNAATCDGVADGEAKEKHKKKKKKPLRINLDGHS